MVFEDKSNDKYWYLLVFTFIFYINIKDILFSNQASRSSAYL
jgi:hypothetical protein